MRFGKVVKKEEHEIRTGRMAKDPVEKTLKKTSGGGSSKKKEKDAESPRGRSPTPKEGGHKSANSSKSSRKKGSKSRSKSKSSRGERSSSGRRAVDVQVIDRIPTAVDYHSDDSEDEWLEQKSKCSRYQLEEDQDQFTDEERENEREPPEMNDDDEPEEDDGDRYSMKKEKKNNPTATKVEDEASFDSNMRMRERLMQDVEQESKLTSSTPIYDSPPNKKKGKEKSKDRSESRTKRRSSSKSSKKKVETPKSKKTRSSSKTRENKKKSSTSRSETSHSRSKSSKSLKGRRSTPSSSSKKHSLSSSGSRKRLEQPADELPTKLSSSDLSPSAASDTSSLTDPLHTMLNYTATDKVVREIEQKLKLLKQTAAKEKAEAERAARKRSKSKDRHHSKKKTVETSSSQKYRGKKIPVVTTPTPQSLRSPKDEVEMMRSDSTENKDVEVKEMPSKETATSDTKREKDVLTTQQETDERALKSQKSDSSGVSFAKLFSKTKISVAKRDDGNDPKTEQVTAGEEGTNLNSMYTKALFTADDSMVDKSVISGSGLPSADIKAPPKKSNTSETEGYKPVELKKTRSWFGWQKKEKKTGHKKLPTIKIGRKQRSRSIVLWKKSASSTRIMDETENVPTAKTLVKTASAASKSHSSKSHSSKEDEDSRLQRITPLVEVKKQKNNLVRELDEYSVTQGNTDEPGVVQCLKFYSCGALANNVNVAIQAVNCHGPAIQSQDEEDGILQTIPTTPQPAVEVVLDDILHPQQEAVHKHKHEHGRIGRSILSCGGSGSWEDAVSTSASVIVDVTEKQLHLDSGSVVEERQKQPPAPVKYVAEEPILRSRSGISITSVHVPSPTKKTKKIKNSEKKKGESKKKVKTQSRETVVRKAETETDDDEEETTEHDEEGNEPPLDATMAANVKGPLRKLVRRFRKK